MADEESRLNAVLDSALDEFEDDLPRNDDDTLDPAQVLASCLQHLHVQSSESTIYQNLQSELTSELRRSDEPSRRTPKSTKRDKGIATGTTTMGTKATTATETTAPSTNATQVADAISHLVQEMNQDDDDNNEPPEALLNAILQGLPGVNDDGDIMNPDALIDGMMSQVLSKELMYDPMRQIAAKFPGWLQTHQTRLSDSEYREREQQYQCFQQLVVAYEREPNDIAEIMRLMEQVQEYGQPPAEIVQEISPGLELDQEGLPKLDNPNPDDCRPS